jgi:integrase
MDEKEKKFKGLYRMPESKYWWFRYTKEGQRHAVSLRTDDLDEATTRAQAILADGLMAAKAYTPTKSIPEKREITGLIERYLQEAQDRDKKPLRVRTANVRRYILNRFVSDCGIHQVSGITLPKIQDWLTQLKAEGKAKDTIWGNGQRVRSFVQYLVAKKFLPASILVDFSVPEQSSVGRKNWIRKDEVTRVLDAASGAPILKFALFCGFDAGLRRNEISEARIEWFDLEHNLLHVMEHENFVPKDRENRAIPLTPRFSDFLKGFLQGRNQNEYVLAPEKTKKGKSEYRYDTNNRVRSHFLRCKIKSSFHDMRRSFASNRVSAGQSIYIVARWLGDGIVVTERSYGHLEPQGDQISLGV